MIQQKSYSIPMLWLLLILFGCLLMNLSLGSVDIPFTEMLKGLFGAEIKPSWHHILLNYRLPKSITAIIVGGGLAICGLLMQTLFRNPLAGPFVLGVSSGASLGVALLLMGAGLFTVSVSPFLLSNLALSIAASAGAIFVLAIILTVSRNIKNTMSILIIGLMFGSFTAAIISVLAYFSSAEKLQQYVFWTFGSLGNLNWVEISILSSFFLLSIGLVLPLIKSLNSLLLGERYAISLGVNLKKTRNHTMLITGLLTGVITAFVGPIAFIGLAVPHLTKLVVKTSDHRILIPATALGGAILMLICDTIAQLPSSAYTLPINAVTSLFGAPIVIWLLVRKRKVY
ncbi:iron ABC transporter permease [Flavobacteriaceae bacterium F08102]|nr:iron ABC transporter permease [Flavobacteriaceae bacterium F08102]